MYVFDYFKDIFSFEIVDLHKWQNSTIRTEWYLIQYDIVFICKSFKSFLRAFVYGLHVC